VKTVVLDNKSYTKASEVAAQFGYTSDYIGQLCRGKKVDARLIGRTWFVHLPSVESHRDQRYAYQKTQATTPTKRAIYNDLPDHSDTDVAVDMTSKKYIKRVVPPPLSHRPFRPSSTAEETFFNPRQHKYELDEYVLNPKVAKEPKITLLKVDIAESESVAVQSSDVRGITMKPEPLPEVALRGTLKIRTIADDVEVPEDAPTDEIEDTKDTKDTTSSIRDNKENKEHITLHPESAQSGRGLKVAIHTEDDASSHRIQKATPAVARQPKKAPSTTNDDTFTYQVAVRRAEMPDDVPILSSDESIIKEVSIISPWQLVSLYAFGFVLALVSAGTVLMVESEVVATATESSRGVVLQPASLMEIFDRVWK